MNLEDYLKTVDDQTREFYETYCKLPPERQRLIWLMFFGSPEQRHDAEQEVYRVIEADGNDPTPVREAMALCAKEEEEERKRKQQS